MYNTYQFKRTILCLFLCLVFFNPYTAAQFREHFDSNEIFYLQQSDSLYKASGVESRTIYKEDMITKRKKLVAKMKMDKEGRIISIEYPKFLGGQTKTTYFMYDASGRLAGMKDILVKGKPSGIFEGLFGDEEKYKEAIKAIPARQYFSYDIMAGGDTVRSVSRIDDSSKVISVSTFEENGAKRSFSEFKEFGFTATVHYGTVKGFAYLPVFFSYHYANRKPETLTAAYEQKDGIITQLRVTKVIDPEKEDINIIDMFTLLYDSRQLLKSADGKFVRYIYGYTFF